MVKKAVLWIIVVFALVGMAQAQIATYAQDYVSGAISFSSFIAQANNWVGASSAYTFSYPADKLDGTYVLGGRTGPNYDIIPGYREDFTYSANYPIYGAWEIRDFTDFRNKCFVGDCNHANLRHVICFDSQGIPTGDSSTCNKWVNTYGSQHTAFCVDGLWWILFDELSPSTTTCSPKTTINFYYIYNDWPGYEGYDSTWQSRWSAKMDAANQILAKYNIHLTANYYEYKLPDDSELPGAIYDYVGWQGNDNSMQMPADIHATILAGVEHPSAYGYECPGTTPYNPCQANSGLRFPDTEYFQESEIVLPHEIGHKFGCPHTGEKGSLSAHLYVGDLMSYGQVPVLDYLYECRLALWVMGQNG